MSLQPKCLGHLLWMDEILYHLRNPGMMIPLKLATNIGFPWFQSAVKWISSIHSMARAGDVFGRAGWAPNTSGRFQVPQPATPPSPIPGLPGSVLLGRNYKENQTFLEGALQQKGCNHVNICPLSPSGHPHPATQQGHFPRLHLGAAVDLGAQGSLGPT